MDDEETLDPFFAEGLVTEVMRTIKSGKEAAVWLCRGGPAAGSPLVAAKVYRSRHRRNFKNDAIYKEGRVIQKRRIRVAVEKKTRFGRELEDGWWVNRESEALTTLHAAGADVPRPIAASGAAVLMEYIGDAKEAAPQLLRVSLDTEEAQRAFDRLLWNLELWLSRDVVHADLSAYNILYWEDRAIVIDFPQSIDARTNPNARELLARDLTHLCRHFARYGVEENAADLTEDLWSRYAYARL